MMAFKLADRGLGFISTLILVCVLVPDDVGIVATVTAVITLIELFSGQPWSQTQAILQPTECRQIPLRSMHSCLL